jgi:diadenosine tetraphosphate (Ap4A) HIT family hydrolase
MKDCIYCSDTTDKVIWRNEFCRVMYIHDSPFAGWCRVVWNRHEEELTDLSEADRNRLMAAAFAVEAGLRKLLAPAKINIASLGTALPHVHWHIIPRFADDTHFPEPVWSTPLRPHSGRTVSPEFVASMQAHLDTALGSQGD